MKKLLITLSCFLCLILNNNLAIAQDKVAYVNFAELVKALPEAADIKSKIDAYSNQYMDQLKSMYTEYQAKGQEFQKQQASMTDAVRSAKQVELADLQKRMNDYQNEAQQKVAARTDGLSKPLLEKVKAAIAQVAKEKGYTYVLDSSQTDLIVSPPGDDLGPAVKIKLGIK